MEQEDSGGNSYSDKLLELDHSRIPESIWGISIV